MCNRLGTALSAGVDLRRAWEREAERLPAGFKDEMREIGRQLKKGASLADAIGAEGQLFPPLVHDLVEVGEATGKLDSVFTRLAEHYETRIRLGRTFAMGIFWPMLQLIVAILLLGVLILASGWISRLAGQRIDFLGLGLIGEKAAVAYYALVAAIAGLVVFAWRGMTGGWLRSGIVYGLLRRIPGLGSWLETLSLAGFSWGLALAVESGLDIRRAVLVATQLSRNPRMLAQSRQVDRSVARGHEVHEALREAGVYPNELLDAIEVGEQTGKLDEAMKRLSRQYESQAQAQGKSVTVVGAFLVWGCVATFIVAAIFRLAMFYSDMLQSI
jgi:type II secretory pathway component PulF